MTTRPSRRSVLRAGAVLGAVSVVATGCADAADRSPLVLATGVAQGVYARMGQALVERWGAELDVDARVLGSDGSVANLALLRSGRVDAAFCAIDVASEPRAGDPPVSALARVHDDATQLVVPSASPVRRLTDLRGRRVSIGAPTSGVLVIASRLLATVGLSPGGPGGGLDAVRLGLDDSLLALADGRIDAFFWSGGLPTAGVDALAARLPLRLVDLAAETAALRARHPVYDATTVPARTYALPDPVVTTSVRNVLLVGPAMPASRAEALTRLLLEHRADLARADPAARSIDPRSAIGTQPVPLHPGAVAAYRAFKDG